MEIRTTSTLTPKAQMTYNHRPYRMLTWCTQRTIHIFFHILNQNMYFLK
uniref:Uncharacterized protein n=1 Tax=Rhizophora mucronata TaxID=61149 RepID=A0A2P2P3U5_RHIMU